MPRTMTIIAVLVLSAPTLLSAGAHHDAGSAKLAKCSAPKLSTAVAISIALGELEHIKVDTSSVAPPTATCSVTAKSNTWSVFLGKNQVMPVGCCRASVDDDSGKVNSVYKLTGEFCAG